MLRLMSLVLITVFMHLIGHYPYDHMYLTSVLCWKNWCNFIISWTQNLIQYVCYVFLFSLEAFALEVFFFYELNLTNELCTVFWLCIE